MTHTLELWLTFAACVLALVAGALYGVLWSGIFLRRPLLLFLTALIRLSSTIFFLLILLNLPFLRAILVMCLGCLTTYMTANRLK